MPDARDAPGPASDDVDGAAQLMSDPQLDIEGRSVDGRAAVDGLVAGLTPIGLAEAESVSLLGRFDRKFLLDGGQLDRLVGSLGPTWSVLEVDGRRSTSYSSVYFDTADLLTYRAHVQGRRNRFKVRTRHYGDPSATVLEVKLKAVRGRTVKHRCPHPGPDPATLCAESMAHVRSTVWQAYGFEPPAELSASVATAYRRTTLADLTTGVRVTIDRDLRVSAVGRDVTVATDVVAGVDVGSDDVGRGDIGRGDSGRGDVVRGDAGRGVLGRGVLGRGDAGRGVLGRGVVGRGDSGRGVLGRGVLGRGDAVRLGEGLAIVEVKSASVRSPVERLLIDAGARPERLSKYCLGVIALHPDIAGNPWRPPLRRLLPAGR